MSAWENEPDRWEGEMCLALRNRIMGHWCGYVALPEGHPWHGVASTRDIPASVHGGITWSDDRLPGEKPDGLWWIGFDCGHANDLKPFMSANFNMPGATYQTLEQVQKNIVGLMRQAIEARKTA